MSKPFVAAGILILLDRGLISVKDPVAKYLPCFKDKRTVNSSAKQIPVTILHLLTHTSGLPYGIDFGQAPSNSELERCDPLVQRTESKEIKSLAQFVEELAQLPLEFAPGKEYHYSYSTDVLGRVIEVISGMQLETFLKKEVWSPLGMKDTGFSFPASKAKRLAAVYCGAGSARSLNKVNSGVVKPIPRRKNALCRIDGLKAKDSRWRKGSSCLIQSGGGMMGHNQGGLISTVNDCIRFLGMLAGGGKLGTVRLMKEETTKRYCYKDLFPQVIKSGKKQKADGTPFGWTALGEVGIPLGPRDVKPDEKDAFEVGEVGGGGAACTYWSINPSREIAVAWFTQEMDNDPYVEEDENIYAAARKVCPKRTVRKSRVGVKKTITKKRSKRA
jgi:CubicO group peptidase (beta-lactamase class C family)